MKNEKIILIMFGILLVTIFACTKAPTTPTQTCDDFCKAQTHTDCAGTWQISGTYPSCVCNYQCNTATGTTGGTGTTGTGTTPTADARKVYSADNKFYIRVANNTVKDGYVEYVDGDRLVLGGSGLSQVSSAEVYLTAPKATTPMLIGIMHTYTEAGENIMDFPLKRVDAGALTLKLYDSANKEITTTGLTVNIVPQIG